MGLTITIPKYFDFVKFAFDRLNLKLEPSGAIALACLLENKEKFKNSRTLIMLSGGNVDEETFINCLARANP